MTAPLDLSKPSFRGAFHIAHQSALAHARANGRTVVSLPDKPVYDAELARLLWSVESCEGGFLGASEAQLMERAGRYRLSAQVVGDALWTAGAWPTPAAIASAESEAA